jgi:hypothetical protein
LCDKIDGKNIYSQDLAQGINVLIKRNSRLQQERDNSQTVPSVLWDLSHPPTSMLLGPGLKMESLVATSILFTYK